MPEPILDAEKNRKWFNWHRTDGVGGNVDMFFTPQNRWADSTPIDPAKKFAPGLAALQKIVGLAAANGQRVRAIGSGWSLSGVAFVEDYLVNTARLNEWSIGLSPLSVTDAFKDRAGRIVFAQCGTAITELNSGLEEVGLALATAGASNGQTIAGAMSTGTHGSAHSVGAIHDCVRALHIVRDSEHHYLIQPKSAPLLTQSYANWLGAKLIAADSDDLFNAAVVSFGSFGLIHGVLLEAEPLYLLGLFNKQFDFDDVKQAALTHDISRLQLAPPPNDPYHIEFVLNPYLRGTGQKGAFVRVLYRQAYDPNKGLPVLPIVGGKTLRAHDLVSAIAIGSDVAPGAISGVLQGQLESNVPSTKDRVISGTPGQHFGDTSPTNGGTSIEIGVPMDRIAQALDAILKVTDAYPFGAPIALRYVKASNALLAFTRYAPVTCTIEMPGIDSHRSGEGHRRIEDELRRAGVPHTYHWGQAMPLNPQQVRDGFGEERVKRWREARRAFLTPKQCSMFSNPTVDACGLSS